MELTLQHLQAIIGNNPYLEHWYEALSKALPDYEINTPQRLAAWFGETKVESANYTAIKENLNYRAESLCRVWPKYFPNIDVARQYAQKPEMIANRAYGGRMGNGAEASGDGYKFRGRGFIQLTGRDNYRMAGQALGIDLLNHPELASKPEVAAQIAVWYWKNRVAPKVDSFKDTKAVTKTINPGMKHLDQRADKLKSFQVAMK